MKNKIYLLIALLLTVITSACSDWLSVKPSDRVSEENNFSSLAGFKQATNGIYVELNNTAIYGRALSCEFIEIIAQRYSISETNAKTRYELSKLNYGDGGALGTLTSMWSKAYNLIANANLLIKNCEQRRDVLPDEYYHIIKGEAYALRALLHFDMFRVFGPLYTPGNDIKSIPYYTEFSLNVAPTIGSLEFMENVISDLKVAEEELQDDPIIRYGVDGNPKDIFLQYRNIRLNLYAVQGLLARCYYYMHDDEHAYEYARKVIDIQELYFPWIKPITLTRTNPDRVFSTEIMFALQNLKRNTLFTNLFDAANLKETTLLAPLEDVYTQIFEGSKASGDFRSMACFKTTAEVNGHRYRQFAKYQGETESDSLYMQMIPMVRVSEAYLIATETAPTTEERLERLNTLRNNRGLESAQYSWDVEPSDNQSSLFEKEWIKEFYGEGQLFFWYKRNKSYTMRSSTDVYNDNPFRLRSLDDYVLPIPEDEKKYN